MGSAPNMTNRERFRASMGFEKTDRCRHIEAGFWDQTYERWKSEGLPAGIKQFEYGGLAQGTDLFDYFGVTKYDRLDVDMYYHPPFEVKAGMDVVKIGEEFPTLRILGGIDKHALERTKVDIDAELDRVLPAMIKRGGYVVGLDHWVRSAIPLENFQYYVDRVRSFRSGRHGGFD